jgi:hypothetical protein
MRQYLTPDRIANKVRMLRQHPSYKQVAFVFVEGASDSKFYERFLPKEQCFMQSTNGKEQAITVMHILEKDSFAGILALLDADFDWLEEKPPSSSNILLTDNHDLETMLLNSPALDKVLREYGSQDKLAEKDVRAILLTCGKPIGYLRWIALQDNLPLTFEKLKFRDVLGKDNLSLDTTELVRLVKAHSQIPSPTEQELLARLEHMQNSQHDAWQICCGHDLVCILSEGLRHAFGSCDARDVSPEALERSLRLAYEDAFFVQTALAASIRAWEQTNTPFVVLKPHIA